MCQRDNLEKLFKGTNLSSFQSRLSAARDLCVLVVNNKLMLVKFKTDKPILVRAYVNITI